MIFVLAEAEKNIKNAMATPTKPLNIIQKFTFFIGSFLVASMIFVSCLKLVSSYWGALLGLIVTSGIGIMLLKKQKAEKDKLIAYGVLACTLFIIIAFIVIFTMAQSIIS